MIDVAVEILDTPTVGVEIPDMVIQTSPNLQSKQVEITENGTHAITADDGYDGLSELAINTNVQPNLEDLSVELTENGSYHFEPSEDKQGFSNVEITAALPDVEFSSDGRMFKKRVIIPSGVTQIGNYAYYKSSLDEVVIPDTVLTIGSMSLNSSKIKAINIPDTVLTIEGDGTMGYCSSLTNVNIGRGLKSLPYRLFYYCTALTDVFLPNTLQNANGGYNPFGGCSNLERVVLENGFNAKNLVLSNSTKYSKDTIVSWLNALYDRTGLETYTLTIGTTNLNKLTDEEKAIATSKNWILA